MTIIIAIFIIMNLLLFDILLLQDSSIASWLGKKMHCSAL